MLNQMQRGIRMMIGRAIVNLLVEGAGLQKVQLDLLDGETIDDVERFQDYGFVSRPRAGAEALVLCLGGSRDQAVAAVVADRRYRPTDLEEGEAALHDDQEQLVILRRDGVLIKTPLKATIQAGGDLLITSDSKITVQAQQVDVLGDTVNLGGAGGQRVARLGDAVAGGVITGGSTKVRCA